MPDGGLAPEIASRLVAEALVEGDDGETAFDLLPVLCHRRRHDACRRAVLARADRYITREVPNA